MCSRTLKFFIPEKKSLNIFSQLEAAYVARRLQPRKLTSLVGKLQSCSLALGPVVRLMTRNFYRFICQVVEENSWSYFSFVPEEVKVENLFRFRIWPT